MLIQSMQLDSHVVQIAAGQIADAERSVEEMRCRRDGDMQASNDNRSGSRPSSTFVRMCTGGFGGASADLSYVGGNLNGTLRTTHISRSRSVSARTPEP